MLTSNGLHPIQKLIFKSPGLFPFCFECLNTPQFLDQRGQKGEGKTLHCPIQVGPASVFFPFFFSVWPRNSPLASSDQVFTAPSSFATQGQPNTHPGTLTLPDKSENGIWVGICSCGVLERFIVALGMGETGSKLRLLGLTFFSVALLLLFYIRLSGLPYGRNDRRLRLAFS